MQGVLIFLSIFLLYLPFTVFGLLAKGSFIKRYLIGFAFSFIPTILLYQATNYFNFPLSFWSITIFYLVVLIPAWLVAYKKGKTNKVFSVTDGDITSFFIILIFTTIVASGVITSDSTFIANGMGYFAKEKLVVDSAKEYNEFPVYDPKVSAGEPTFLFAGPMVFSQVGFANILLPFESVMFYNCFEFFILFLTSLSAFIFLKSIIRGFWMPLIGGISIGLNFYFIQYMESVKEFFIFPVTFLLFAILLEGPRDLKEITLVLYLLVLSALIHVTHTLGVALITMGIVTILVWRNIEKVKVFVFNNKLKLAAIAGLFFLIPLFYLTPSFIFKESLSKAFQEEATWKIGTSTEYVTRFFKEDTALSTSYPEPDRIDDKRYGPVISILGLIAIPAIFLFRRRETFKAKTFVLAYFFHFVASAILVNHPALQAGGGLEYVYRTAYPYFLAVLVVSVCAVVSNFPKALKYFFVAVLATGFVVSVPALKANAEGAHNEGFVGRGLYGPEIEFVKTLPIDGRIITYGLFANSVDTGMSSLTGRYFARHHISVFPREKSVYRKVHGAESWGYKPLRENLSGKYLFELFKAGGYKYVFLNGCVDAGNYVAFVIFPEFSFPIYQRECLAFFEVKNVSYAEKTDGTPLSFFRLKPREVSVFGNFSSGERVVFKESFFPRWKASMGGEELEVSVNQHNMIEVTTIEGQQIDLRYEVLKPEKTFGTISFIALLFLTGMFINYLRRN